MIRWCPKNAENRQPADPRRQQGAARAQGQRVHFQCKKKKRHNITVILRTCTTQTESQNCTQHTADTNTKEQMKAPAGSQGGNTWNTRELAEQKATRVAEAILDMEYTFMDENVLNLSVKRKSTL